MLLSISSSKPKSAVLNRVHTSVILLLGTIVLFLVALEIFTRTVVEHRSRVQLEVNREHADALRIRRSTLPGGRQVLLVGNSLVGHGIDMNTLHNALPPDYEVHRFWIYNTSYTDWYFGLRRLFAEGSRPDVVVVVFAALHWYSNDIRGEYGAQYLFETPDIPGVGSSLHMDRTTTSSLLFARYSKFFALRSEIRKYVLHRVIPDLPNMYALFQPALRHHVDNLDVTRILTDRIGAFRSLVESHGSSLILVVPPIPRPGDEHQDEVRIAAERAGVPVIMPMSSTDTPSSDFADDMHLTPKGATIFTSELAKGLLPALAQVPAPASSYSVANKK